jgi:hypothetical protein
VDAAAVTRHPGGRPSALTPEVADVLIARLAAGDTLAAAARAAGIGPRTLRTWRHRAYSTAAQDRLHVALERRIEAALLVAARRAAHPSPRTWQEAAAVLVSQYPERWELPVPDPLEELLDLYAD